MKKRTVITGIGAAVLIAGSVGGVALATSGDDGGGTLSGPQAEDATKAALALTQGGTANSVERDSENGATWEVEVTKTNGDTVDVRLDENYQLVVIEGDSDSNETE